MKRNTVLKVPRDTCIGSFAFFDINRVRIEA